MSHTCHAVDCCASVPPEFLFCRKHWYMTPARIRHRVLETYRPGQCDDWQPSAEYCQAAKEAVLAVAKLEGKKVTDETPEVALYDMFMPKAGFAVKGSPAEVVAEWDRLAREDERPS